MIEVALLVIGGGPAGLCASITAAKSGVEVLIVDRYNELGGQLRKQSHKFFGSKKQYASHRGIDIKNILIEQVSDFDNISIYKNTTVVAIYDDMVVSLLKEDKDYIKIKAKKIIIATGASEKVLSFANNDLPGIYGAGAVQTFMNVYGVKPGKKVVMVGAGNIGLICSYQLVQAGVNVVAVLEASSKIGGYLVHAAKLRRLGIPILTNHSIKRAKGDSYLEEVVIWKLDDNFEGIEGTEENLEVDTVCIAVGLSPLSNLLSQVGCEMIYVSELGGIVPKIDHNHQTSISDIYVAGDVSGIEEASSAMVEGYITGYTVAKALGYFVDDKNLDELREELAVLRSGPAGNRIRKGLSKILRGDINA